MNRQKKFSFWLPRLAITLGLGLMTLSGFGQEWQWSIPVKGGVSTLEKDKAGPARAFLWIPPDCKYVRSVVVAQHNMEEISILENPRFRQAMSELGFAEVWVSPAFDHLFRFNEGAGEVFTNMMNELAEESGYQELTYAPVIGIGHSAAASWPYYLAAWNPERTLAAVSVSGQWPYFRNPIFAPDIWGNRTIDFIPCLETMGEYEAANTWSAEGLKERQEHPLMPLSMLACPAEGHFAATDKKVDYLAFYIKKAAHYRLPKDTPQGKTPQLKPIDPTKTGWLADKWRLNEEPTASAAPVGKYQGDPTQAFWFFDEETVRETEKYQASYRNMQAPLLGYVQEGKVVPQRDTHQQVDLAFLPLSDGITFKLTGAFLDTVPSQSPRPSHWTGLPAGSPIGHPTAGGPISIDKIDGPFHKIDSETFSLRLQRGLGANLKSYECWFTATHPGDKVYKPAVQQARMIVPLRNTEGIDQHLTFPAIADQQAGVKSLPLQATSDAGALVQYYVLMGPALVKGSVLQFTQIPPRSRFPIKVTVVAWQWGSPTDQRTNVPNSNIAGLKTAEPVERSFFIRK